VTDAVTRIAMWSGPRNLSTAMMRSWENRPDTEVMDEPLYAAFLATSGLDHPAAAEIIAAGHADVDDAIAACFAPLAPGTTISYQKHMAHHLPPGRDLGWIDGLRNCLLLRDPRWVLASYTKVRTSVTLDDIGVPQQLELSGHCELVVDAADFLTDPVGHLRQMCRRLGVPFDDELRSAMSSWPAGRRASDGVWAPHWYSSVEASTGFGPAPTGEPPALPDHLRSLASEAVDMYQELRKRVMRPDELD
jgi:hypothetical protein